MTVKNRRLVYTHPLTGAQSHLLTIERMDGNQPMQLPPRCASGCERLSDRARRLQRRYARQAAIPRPVLEMVAWKVRLFVLASDDGQAALARLIE